MDRAVIIIDATRLAGTTWQEIGDYLAVVSLAQISMERLAGLQENQLVSQMANRERDLGEQVRPGLPDR